jgi:hypothetical protein
VEDFGTVVIAIAVVGAVVAALSYLHSGRVYRGIGRGGLSLDEPDLRRVPERGSRAWDAEAQVELRQLLEAKADRAEARGEARIDVDEEVARLGELMRGAADPALRAEVRDLVVASNERRARRGQPLLDVEAEIERRLREAGSLGA